LAARFSTVATAALVVVSLAGIAMSVMILDEATQLWSTRWGGLLLAKVAIVGLAAAAGAYNHFRLVPQLAATADDDSPVGQTVVDRFRMLATAEGAVLVVVVALTALLVQNSPA
jgi:putative copper export protein